MAIGPDLRQRPRLADEGIVRRHRTIGPDAHNLPHVTVQILRTVTETVAVAQRDEEIAVAPENQSRTPVVAARRGLVLCKDDLHFAQLQCVAVQHCARHGGACPVPRGLCKGKEDRAVRCKRRTEHNIKQAALSARVHIGHTRNRRRHRALWRHDAHAPRALGHQHATIGQKSQRPGRLEPACHYRDPYRARCLGHADHQQQHHRQQPASQPPAHAGHTSFSSHLQPPDSGARPWLHLGLRQQPAEIVRGPDTPPRTSCRALQTTINCFENATICAMQERKC